MNTPAHVIINLYLFRKEERLSLQATVILGALLPDLPIFSFYFYKKIIRNVPEAVIWQNHYFLSGWQNLFDIFNSMPLALMGLALSMRKKARGGTLFFGSIMLHLTADFFLHNDDAHRHFLPFTNWRFISPVSYWDPQHYGGIVSILEMVIAFSLGVLLIKTFHMKINGIIAGCWILIYALYEVYILVVWT